MLNKNTIILLDGFRLLVHPKIRKFVLLPLLSNFILFIGMLYGFYHLATHWQQELVASLPEWLHYASWLVWPLAILTAILLFIYGFTLLGNLIAAPFNAFLSEAVERMHGYIPEDSGLDLKHALVSIPASLKRELQKILYSIKWWILIIILWFIPGLNLLSLLITAWLLSMQYIDYPADNHRIPFRDAIKLLRKKWTSALPFGLTVAVANMIPIVNIVTMSAAVCGATLLWHRDGFQQSTEQKNLPL